MTARLRLRRQDGNVYLERWGVELDRLGGVFVHRMSAGDPGLDMHDHPWWFVSLILRGGYVERRARTHTSLFWRDDLPLEGRFLWPLTELKSSRKAFSVRVMPLNACHQITHLLCSSSWSLVIHGPRRRRWGFYTPQGFVDWEAYEGTSRGLQRGLNWHEVG